MDEGDDGRDKEQHHSREPVDGEADVNIEHTRSQPGVEWEARLVAVGHIEKDQEREEPRYEDSRNRDKMGVVLNPVAEEPEYQERD